MGEALFRGFLQAGIVKPDQVLLSDVNKERLSALSRSYGVNIAVSNSEAVEKADIVLLAVKPQQIDETLNEVKGAFRKEQLVISIAAGVTTEKIVSLIGQDIPVIRVMPNTPALVAKAMSVISPGRFADEASTKIALELFASVGEAIELPENLQNQATAVSGSGPAYFFLITEALVRAGMLSGLDEASASKLAAQTLFGSAHLLKETGEKPEALREKVTSPGGTTAAALKVFSDHDFMGMVQEAVEAAIKRAGELA
jgi:pyrroline-5-carboxylate reductase